MSAERARRGDESAAEPRALQTGGGGGTSDGMDARVARLEAHVETLRSESAATRTDLADMRVSLATLAERVAHMPSKGFVMSANVSMLGFFSALILFSEKLKALAGL
jgi:hypothetical protein